MTRLALIGGTTLNTAYSRVNRVWLSGLEAAGYDTSSKRASDVLIHHDYRRHFATCRAGTAKLKIAVRTWDFGPYPSAWAARIGRDFDRLWVHSEWIGQKAVEAGVDRDRLAVVPHGFDPRVFRVDGPAGELKAEFNFLFVGAAVARKGIDILLRAYAQAFAPDESVCLILKGHSADVFYRGQHMSDAIADFQSDPSKPALLHIDARLTPNELAALYRAADVGVFPYRAEGFAIPILEAMACGLSCIVPRFGACLDYCTEDNAFFVEARRIRLPVRRDFAFNSLGFQERVDAVDFCEVPVDTLASALRAVYEGGARERQARGEAAARSARDHWTWDHSIERILRLLEDLQCGP